MTDKELRKLKRIELLELLVDQAAEMEELRKRLAQAEEKLGSRELMIQESGSLAEAALKLNDVFAAADRAARDYLDNAQALRARQEALLSQAEAAAREQAEKLLARAREECRVLEQETRDRCQAMLEQARREGEAQG